MQTPIAENHIRITHPLFQEAMKAVEQDTYKKTVRKLAAVLAVIFLAIAVYFYYKELSLIFLLGESIFLCALLFWLLVMLPGTKRRSKYKALKAGSPDLPQRTIYAYEDHLTVKTPAGKETVLTWETCSGFRETTHLYILTFHQNTHVLLAKDGFVCGDFRVIQKLI